MYEQNTFIEWEGQLPWEKERKKNLGFISSIFLLQFGKVIHSDGCLAFSIYKIKWLLRLSH